MKTINRVVVHATGTDTKCSMKECAYGEDGKPMFHYVVARDGEVKQLCFEPWPLEERHDVHLAYIGGRGKDGAREDNRTIYQKEAMFYKLVELTSRYNGLEFVSAEGKTNPGFNVAEWVKEYDPTLCLDEDEFDLAA